MKAEKKSTIRSLAQAARQAVFFCMGVCLSLAVCSQPYPPKTGPVYDEAINYLSSSHGGLAVGNTIPLTYTPAGEATPAKITNIVALKLNEEGTTYLPDNFTASVTVGIDYGPSSTSTTHVNQILTISYNKGAGVSYNPKQYLTFSGAQYVLVTLQSPLPTATLSNGVSVLNLLRVTNEMHIWRNYTLSTSGSVTPTLQLNTATGSPVPDELPVQWTLPAGNPGHNGVQLEWAWLENELTSLYTVNGSLSTDLLFKSNSTRVNLPMGANGYNIPLYYDGTGNLYCRVRLVNIQYNGTVSPGPWSTVQTYAFNGHNNDLNWQVTTSYSEDGKRKVAMEYFDGSLRERQTVTKDNSTNTTVSAETYYDGQGRPAVQILPAPGINSVVAYNQTLNLFNSQTPGSDPGPSFDIGLGYHSATSPMAAGYGAALYYSASNPEIAQGANQNIPDAGGYPYTVTRYTPDETGRIMAESGIGPALKMESNHETKYFYGTPAQEDLDGLFGTDVGDFTHYFKNMVRDANGQSSFTYVDMHGRTIATSLAGGPPNSGILGLSPGSADYPGQAATQVTHNLLNGNANVVRGMSIESNTALLVPVDAPYSFDYKLTAQSFQPTVNGTIVCYSCLYDLEIDITSESGAQGPLVLKYQGLQVAQPGVCQSQQPTLSALSGTIIPPDGNGNQVDFSVQLAAGSYSVHKTLTVDPAYYAQYQADYLARVLPDINTLINNEYQTLLATSNCAVTPTTTPCQACQNALGTYTAFKANYLANYPAGSQPSDATVQALYNTDLANCNSLCTNKSHLLDDIQSLMLSDMMPGSGQYAQYPIPSPIPSGEVAMYNKYDIFSSGGFSGQPFYENPQNGGYQDASGNVVTAPTDAAGFTSAFTPSWANALLPRHPEYAKLQYARAHLASAYDFIEGMNSVTTFSNAISQGYTNSAGATENYDPLFATGNDVAGAATVHQYETSQYYNGLSIWQLAYAGAVCNTATSETDQQTCLSGVPVSPPFTSITTAQMDQVWTLYKGIYRAFRDSLQAKYLDAQAPVTDANTLANSGYYILRFPVTAQQIVNQFNWTGFPTGDATNAPSVDLNQMTVQTATNICGGYIQAWTDALTNCPVLNGNPNKTAILNAITAGMQTVCLKGIDASNPGGSSSVAPSTPQDGSPRNFETVIDNVFAQYGLSPAYKDQLCNPFLITAPGPYGKNPLEIPPVPMGGVDACACSQWARISAAATTAGYNPNSLSSINTYLRTTYGGDTITQVILNGLQQCSKIGTQECFQTVSSYIDLCSAPSQCNPTQTEAIGKNQEVCDTCHCVKYCYGQVCQTITYIPLSSPQVRPSFLTCGFTGKPACVTCAAIATLTQNYKTWFGSQACAAAPVTGSGNLTQDQIGYNVTFANYLNYYTGLNLTWMQYFTAATAAGCNLANYASNGSATQSVVCPPTAALTDPSALTVTNDPCQGVYDQAVAIAQQQYDQLKAKALADFSAYVPFCLSAASETFTTTFVSSEFHYTLYYYDQAGNLVRTVPPKGVRPNFSTTFVGNVEYARSHPGSGAVVPSHVYATNYRYNSLNAIITDSTPDAGISNFFYDLAGRLVVSQSAQQAHDGNYSYTVYDAINRVTEVGQKPQSGMTQAISQNPTSLAAWMNAANLPRVQVTYTAYDAPPLDGSGNPINLVHITPQNLRNRVAFKYTKNTETDANPYIVSYYTYDVHGDVDTLMQDYLGVPGMTSSPYKLICYDYDLISGKVNGVDYQPGQADAFYYRYSYDAENRITHASTSRDSIFWEDDARYMYYKHGPLARTVLGQLSVQGMDYNYTLQGWLKGINIGNGFAGVMVDPSGDNCPPGTALSDVVVSSRPAADGPGQYKALHSITFLPGFQTYSGDAMTTLIDPTRSVCTTGTGGSSSDASAGGGGTGNVEAFPVALDAYNMSLHYYQGDYTPIGSTTPTVDVLQSIGSDAAAMFNGNVAATAVNVPAVGNALVYNYHYDQLNRMGQMDAYSGLNMSNNTFSPVKLTDYQERAAYDPNGNIETYTRNGYGSSTAMDNLTYNYYLNTNQLSYIHDIAGGSYTTDLKDQGAGNYTYDLNGNLKQDGTSAITWTVYGKISSVSTGSGTVNYTYDGVGNRVTKAFGGTTTLYVRDVQGNVLSIYTIPSSGVPQQTEVDLYGNKRIGTLGALTAAPTPVNMLNGVTGMLNTFTRGERTYQLTNHLQNVLATITDKKIAVVSGSNGALIDHFMADITTAQDYYPFGMQMPGRTYTLAGAQAYRYGFNGKERNDEVHGAGNQIDYGARIYDPRVGRFLSTDPLTKGYPYYAPYQFAGNMPIAAIDMDGMEQYVVTYYKDQSGNTAGMEVRAARSIKDGQLLDQQVHKGAEGANNPKIAKGNVLVFESRKDKNNKEQLTVVDSRNTPNSALTHDEADLYNRNATPSAFENSKMYFVYPDAGNVQYSSREFLKSQTQDMEAQKWMLDLAGHIFIGTGDLKTGNDFQGKPATNGELDMTSPELLNRLKFIKQQIHDNAATTKTVTISVVGILGPAITSSADPQYTNFQAGLYAAGQQIKKQLIGLGVPADHIIIGVDARLNHGENTGVTATITTTEK